MDRPKKRTGPRVRAVTYLEVVRRQKEVEIRTLSRTTHITEKRLHNLELGKERPTITEMEDIASALDYPSAEKLFSFITLPVDDSRYREVPVLIEKLGAQVEEILQEQAS